MCNELRYYGGVGARCPGYGDRWGKMPRLQGPLGQDVPGYRGRWGKIAPATGIVAGKMPRLRGCLMSKTLLAE